MLDLLPPQGQRHIRGEEIFLTSVPEFAEVAAVAMSQRTQKSLADEPHPQPLQPARLKGMDRLTQLHCSYRGAARS